MTKMVKYIKRVALIGLLVASWNLYSQVEEVPIDDTLNRAGFEQVTDEFQNHFFEALAQRAIGNYQKAIDILSALEKLKGSRKTAVYFELAENYMGLENTAQAEAYFLKALQTKPRDRSILSELYRLYDQTQNYTKAIEIAQKLVSFDIEYYQDLAQLYFRQKQYQSALQALDHIADKKGRSSFRNALRRQIYREATHPKKLIAGLQQKIKSQPDNLLNYADLSYLYLKNHQPDQALTIAKELLNKKADNLPAQIVLYQVYLQKGAHKKAVDAMKILLNNKMTGNEVKKTVVKDFVKLVKKHPEYRDELVWILGKESSVGHQSNQQLGTYYIGKDNAKALVYLEKALQETPHQYDLIKTTLLLQIKVGEFQKALALSQQAASIFPAQAFLYLMQGTAANGLQNYKSALQSLQMGVDFVVENPKLKVDFYRALVKTYEGLNQSKAAAKYQQKIEVLKKKISK